MTDDDPGSFWEIRERDGIRFEPVFPPQHRSDVMSYFGGLPRLPSHIDWPKMRSPLPSGSQALSSTFVGQIDLSELPSIAPNPLPKAGTLFFFVDTAIEDLIFPGTPGTGGTVIYWDQSTSNVPFREEPADLPPCFGEHWGYYFKWLHKDILEKGIAPPKSFTFCDVRSKLLKVHDLLYVGPPFQSIQSVDSDEVRKEKEARNTQRQLAHQNNHGLVNEWLERSKASIAQAASPVVPRNFFIFSVRGSELRLQSRAWRIRERFPFTWIDLEIFFGSLLNRITKFRQQPTTLARGTTDFRYLFRRRKSVGDAVHRIAQLALISARYLLAKLARLAVARDLSRIDREIGTWLNRGKKSGRWTAVPASVRTEFYDWVDRNVSNVTVGSHHPRSWIASHMDLLEAYRIGPRMCLAQSAGAAALVPDSWRESQRWQWETNLSDEKTINHHLLGSCNPITPIHDDNSIKLMEFDTQDCFSWMWGDMGSIAFLIRKDDLVAGNFSQAYVTVYSG